MLPFIILLAVPMAILGALGAQWVRGLQNDVYCQIGLVMLIGLSSKNAILIVEFAEQLQLRGMALLNPTIEAGRLRLRPILMTSIAFILGVLPLVFAKGAGSAGRHSVGTTVFGGMIVSTLLNLFIIPILYVIVRGWMPAKIQQQGSRFPSGNWFTVMTRAGQPGYPTWLLVLSGCRCLCLVVSHADVLR